MIAIKDAVTAGDVDSVEIAMEDAVTGAICEVEARYQALLDGVIERHAAAHRGALDCYPDGLCDLATRCLR